MKQGIIRTNQESPRRYAPPPFNKGGKSSLSPMRERVGVRGIKGFTLAEVLITLGIIGVVAALTMPSLFASYQEKVMVTKLKKFVSVMSQALTMAVAENGSPDEWVSAGTTSEERKALFWEKLSPYLKTIKLYGRNHFKLRYTDTGNVVPEGLPTADKGNELNKYCTTKSANNYYEGEGSTCAAWVLYQGNFDFMKCDDLNWNGKTRCD